MCQFYNTLVWKLLPSSAVKRWLYLVEESIFPFVLLNDFSLCSRFISSPKKILQTKFCRCRPLRCFALAARPLQICFPVNGFGFCRKSRSQRSGQEVPISAEACKRKSLHGNDCRFNVTVDTWQPWHQTILQALKVERTP